MSRNTAIEQKVSASPAKADMGTFQQAAARSIAKPLLMQYAATAAILRVRRHGDWPRELY